MANFVALYSLKLRGVIKDETKSIITKGLKQLQIIATGVVNSQLL